MKAAVQSRSKPLGGGMMMPDSTVASNVIADHMGRYSFAADFIRDKVVLDAACGSGYGSAFLSNKGAKVVIGGDISSQSTQAAARVFRNQTTTFCRLDVTRLPMADGCLDVIVSFETIEHLAEYEAYLHECRRCLKQGGLLILSTPNKRFPTLTSRYHVHEFNVEELRALLLGIFQEARLWGQEHKSRMAMAKENLVNKTERILKPIHTYAPALYDNMRNTYLRFKRPLSTRGSHVRLGGIWNWDSLSDERHVPYPLEDKSVNPRFIVAVARK